MLIYLGLCALATCLVALLLVGEASLLLTTHLVFAMAIVPLIFAAIAHFVPVLTRSGGAPRAIRLAPLLLQLAGLLVALYFSGVAGEGALHAAAGLVTLGSGAFCVWLLRRAANTLGSPHPGWRWYLVALALLAGGVALIPLMSLFPAWRPVLRLLHLHLNTLGFIGLSAIGTLQVLLPTVLSGPDAQAGERLRRDLAPALAAVLAIAIGAAAGWWPLALLGAVGLIWVAGRPGVAWLRRYGWRTLFGDGASASLLLALCGFVLLLVSGVAHAFGVLSGHDAVAAFIAAFLLPLVSGALAQLVPVWLFPGRRTERRDRLRAVLAAGGRLRASCFLVAGVLLALGWSEGGWLAVLGAVLGLWPSMRCLISKMDPNKTES